MDTTEFAHPTGLAQSGELGQPTELAQSGDVVAQLYARLADLVYAHADFSHIGRSACGAALQLVDGCDHASITMRRNGAWATLAASDEIAAMVDAVERAVQDGPCLDGPAEQPIQLDPDLRVPAWPRLAQRVLDETPVRGVVHLRLLVDGDNAASLHVFSDTPGALSPESVHQASVLASFLSVALAAATEHREAVTLRAGLASNREIGRAVGLLMAFHRIDEVEAFGLLRTTSQNLNMKLPVVARQILDHHNSRKDGAKADRGVMRSVPGTGRVESTAN
jgi:hypothetical protein